MTSLLTSPLDAEQGLIQLPGEPAQWIWAFTCSQPECACRTAIVLSAPGGRETLAERGRVVADAWVSHGEYGQAAQELEGVAAFAIDLDTREVYPPLGDRPLDVAGHPALREVIDRMDDDVLDAVARNWYRAKGKEPPHPGHVEFDGKEATLRPDHERHRERLDQLWSAYRERHPRYAERFESRSAVMHGLGDRIVRKASLPRAGRNEPRPCGSGKKYKKCCGAAS